MTRGSFPTARGPAAYAASPVQGPSRIPFSGQTTNQDHGLNEVLVTAQRQKKSRFFRLTPWGKALLLFAAVILFAAMTTGRNVVYLLFSFILSFLVVSSVLATISLSRLRVERVLPRHIFSGKPFLVETRLTNHKQFFPSFSLLVSNVLNRKELEGRYILKLPARSSMALTHKYLIERRGRYIFHGVRLSTTYPPGVFLKGYVVVDPQTIIVYPPIVRLHPHFLNDIASDAGNRVRRTGLSSDLYGFRKYQDGDDSRFINWRLSAKTRKLLVNQYSHEENVRICIVLDNLVHSISESSRRRFESAVTFAASLCSFFIERGYKVKFLSRNAEFPYGEGNVHLFDILRHLALIEPTTGENATVDPYIPDRLQSGVGILLYYDVRPAGAGQFTRAFDYAKWRESLWKPAVSTSLSEY